MDNITDIVRFLNVVKTRQISAMMESNLSGTDPSIWRLEHSRAVEKEYHVLVIGFIQYGLGPQDSLNDKELTRINVTTTQP